MKNQALFQMEEAQKMDFRVVLEVQRICFKNFNAEARFTEHPPLCLIQVPKFAFLSSIYGTRRQKRQSIRQERGYLCMYLCVCMFHVQEEGWGLFLSFLFLFLLIFCDSMQGLYGFGSGSLAGGPDRNQHASCQAGLHYVDIPI